MDNSELDKSDIPTILNNFSAIDDSDIFGLLKIWNNSSDKVLSMV